MTRNASVAVLVGLLALAPVGRAAGADYEPLIRKAMERGVAYLRSTQGADGAWPYGGTGVVGATALAGMALVECDVPVTDSAVRKAAEYVREASPRLDHTYSLALSILFLDRLGDPEDIPLIESMTVRLLAGQRSRGGWTYQCPVNETETRRLEAHLGQRNKLETRPVQRRRLDVPRERRELTKEISSELRRLNQTAPTEGDGDNSNTQFATLALWVAARYDLPVELALLRVDQRFRTSQNPDGGWAYNGGGGSSMAMTCAGLLGLAVAHGLHAVHVNEAKLTQPEKKMPRRPDPAHDPAVRLALQALGGTIGAPVGRIDPQVAALNQTYDYYFLWSLERVAVAYGLKTIGNKDWHAWGTEILLAGQGPNGCWRNDVDTCFALLFLRRANLAEDLSATLKGIVGDPGEVSLRAGGVGGAALKRIVLKPGDNPHNRNVTLTAKQAELSPDVAPLVEAVVKASGKDQAALLTKYQESKGVLYTQALAATIHRLDDSAKRQARDALTERLYRMSAATLRDKLADADPEVRSAAALACGMKKDRQYVADLLGRLDDAESRVARAAHVALKNITGQDFGPAAGATAEERAQAAAAWKAWWKKQRP